MRENPFQSPSPSATAESPLADRPSIFIRWRVVPTSILGIVGSLALVLGAIGFCLDIYRIYFANWFAEGTQSSTFTYYPNKVRMILQSLEILTLGGFWLVAAVVFWRNQLARGTLYFLIGLIAMGGLKITGALLRSIGW